MEEGTFERIQVDILDEVLIYSIPSSTETAQNYFKCITAHRQILKFYFSLTTISKEKFGVKKII